MKDSVNGSRGFWGGALFGICLMMAANGIHWFITPMAHPEVTTARRIGMIVQVVVSVGVAVWLYLQQRKPILPINTKIQS